MARNMREVRGFLCNDEYVIQKAKVTVHHFVETEAWAQILPRDRDEDVEVGEVGDDPVSHASSAAEVDVMSLKLKLLFLWEHTCKEMVRCERFEAWLDSAYGFPAEQWDAENRRRVGGSPRRPRFGRRGKAERRAEAASAQVAASIDSFGFLTG